MNKIRLDNKDLYYQVFYKNIKNMYLRVDPAGHLKVTCNRRVGSEDIRRFITMHKDRVLKKLADLDMRLPLYNPKEFLLFGTIYPIDYHVSLKKNHFEIMEGRAVFRFKADHFDSAYVEAVYKQKVIDKANQLIFELAPQLASDFDLDRIQIKAQLMKSRFGSCIPKKKIIKLNSILARFPDSYLRTILIHEIIHLNVPNHQAGFYRYMDRYAPEYKQQRKMLNQWSRKYVI